MHGVFAMRLLRKWANLPRPERRLFLRALPLVTCVRLGLWALPWPVTRRLSQRLSTTARTARPTPEVDVDAVTRAVSRAARRVPRATCLTQAIAASVMLGRRGIPATIRFGAARDPRGRFIAHAWVESQGRIVIGGVTSPQRYATFPAPAQAGGRAPGPVATGPAPSEEVAA
jgi:hypothetical protein